MEWKIWFTWWIMFCIRYSRLFWIYLKETATDNPLIRIYINKIENRITFKIKTGYYLDVLTQEIMRFLGSTKSKINKNEKGEIMPHL